MGFIKSLDLFRLSLKRADPNGDIIEEMYRNKPGDEASRLMFKYGVDILPDNTILKGGERIGKIEAHMIPSGKYFVRDPHKRELDLKDSFEEALKSLVERE
jgi:hypothetical protein